MKAFKSIGNHLPRLIKGKDGDRDAPNEPEASTSGHAEESLFGLFCLYPQPGQVTGEPVGVQSHTLEAKDSVERNEVDIVAIHGLGGTPRKTWTHENGKLWLEDFAPEVYPAARIYSFGYDSGFAFSKGTGTLRDFAKNFLILLGLERVKTEPSCRPLVLICHSMGGIVAKLAVNIAREDPQSYPGIGEAITAVLFLGTPHQGSSSATYGKVLGQTLNALVIGSQASRFTGPVRTELLRSLRTYDRELLNIAQDFSKHTADIKVRSFIEGKSMKGMNHRIVDDASAFVGGATEKIIPMPGYTHRDICRYGSLNDSGLKLILGTIGECLNTAQNLPTSQSKFPASFSNLPVENKAFVGQQQILENLGSALHEESGNSQVALYGLGGIGKSQVALQYAYGIKQKKPNIPIFWVFAGNRDKFEHAYLEIARGLNLPGCNDPEVDLMQLVKDALEDPKLQGWLMIVDNADDLAFSNRNLGPGSEMQPLSTKFLFDFIPNHPNGSVLYTTRSKADALQLTSLGHIIQVKEMDIDDSKALLHRRLGSDLPDGQECIDLVEALDRLPLALVQATSYIRQNSWSISDYLRHFRGKDEDASLSLLLHDFRDSTRDRTVSNPVFKTWIITVQRLEDQSPRAAEALWLMAFYNRQDIPRSILRNPPPEFAGGIDVFGLEERPLFQESLSSQDPYLKHTDRTTNEGPRKNSEFSLDEAIGQLEAYSFISRTGNGESASYTLHRLVQTFTRYWLKSHMLTADLWISRAIILLAREFPRLTEMDWTKAGQLIPHVQAVFDHHCNSHLPAREFGELFMAAADYLRMKAQYPLAEKYARSSMEVLRKSFGEYDPATIEALYTMAHVLGNTDPLNKSEHLFRDVVSSAENAPEGERSARLQIVKLQAMSSLSNIARIKKQYQEASDLANQSVEGFKMLLGSSSGYTLDSMTVLSTVLGDSGLNEEALKIQEELVTIFESRFGTNSLRTMHAKHNLAVTLNRLGKIEIAETISREVLGSYEREYGPYHQRTSSIASNLADILEKRGLYSEASNLLTLALKYRRTHLGENNELTAESILHLAFCLEKQRRYEDAIIGYQELCDIFRACHGSESPATKGHEGDLLRVRELLRHELQPGNVQSTATYHNATPNINTQYSSFTTQSTQYSSFQPSDPYYGR